MPWCHAQLHRLANRTSTGCRWVRKHHLTVRELSGTLSQRSTQRERNERRQSLTLNPRCPAIQPRGTNFTRNDIVDGICKPITLIFARGTTEDANLGNLVGPPFISALNATFGAENVAVQGVNDYAAIGPEYCAGGSLTGSENLAMVC